MVYKHPETTHSLSENANWEGTMKISCIWLLALLIALGACSEKKEETTHKETQAPVVYVSNYPLKYFVERMAPTPVEVRFPVPANDDPTYWKPKPEDVLALQKADLIFLNGASYEPWLNNVSLSQSKLVDTSAGFRDQLIPLKQTMTHSHGMEGEHEHSETAFTTWLDLKLAKSQAGKAKDVLVARWPQHKESIESQFIDLSQDLSALDAEIKNVVAGNPNLAVLFSHPVYQYFEAAYGVKGRSVHWEPGKMPDDAKWGELTALLKEHPAKWMIWEGNPDSKIVSKLKGIGLESAVFAPCANTPESGDFLTVMRENMAEIKRVFGPGEL
jgi:zinc transport system substrate-binding protein